jgi:Domain of unknown function (DUF2017)
MYRFGLSDDERAVLRSLLPQLRELVSSPPDQQDERVRRLFPTAYHQDPEHDAEYQRFMHDELVASRLAAITRVEESLDATELTEDQLVGWMQSVNSVRLVLGTLLDVDEEPHAPEVDESEPDAHGYALYGYLSSLLEEIVQAMSA